MRTFRVWLLLIASLLLWIAIAAPVPAAAQGGDSCLADVLLALGRAGAVCNNLANNLACYGNGSMTAEFQPGVSGMSFAAPGDRVNVAALRQVHVASSGDGASGWSVAALQIQADLPETEQRNVTLLLFGNMTIENVVPPLPTLIATATGTLNIRRSSESSGEIIERLGVRDTVTANGRTGDGRWLRVLTPGTSELGWASVDVVSIEGDPAILNVVDAATPFHRPFQTFTVSTGVDDAPCTGTPESGLIIQTPNTFTEVELTVNGVTLRLAATAFVQAQPGGLMTISVLDGQVEALVGGTVRFVPAGARTVIPLGSDLMAADAPSPTEPYLTEDVQALPINNLGYRFGIPAPLAQAEIDVLVAAHFAPPPTATPPTPATGSSRCVRSTRQDTSLRAGPGMFYEVINEIDSSTRVYPVLQITDAENIVWWQLRNSNWIRADLVESSGDCPAVPVTEVVPPPAYNGLSLETCMTDNGPLRAGQQVTLDFVPPGWETFQDAQLAVHVDPGQITVDSQALRVGASRPVRIAEDRYIRTFSASWTATEGTHHIVGERLSYIAICDVSVPIGP